MNARYIHFGSIFGAVLGLFLYFESYNAPFHCCGMSWPYPNAIQAERILLPDNGPVDLNNQLIAGRMITAARPADVSAWLRIAYAQSRKEGGLNRAAIRAIGNSYGIAVYAGHLAPWRIAFLLDQWENVPQPLRFAVLYEITAIRQDHRYRRQLITLAPGIRSPHGRLIAYANGFLKQ